MEGFAMSCCGGTCCAGRPWSLVVLVGAMAGAGVMGYMARARDAGATQPAGAAAAKQEGEPVANEDPAYVLDHRVKRIDGTEEDLSAYEGKVVLIVNVASRCGMTPQYAGLEALYREKKDEGLVVLGFPANDFRGQEPGTNDEIARFCEAEYGVTFPLFEKIVVTGEEKHPLYEDLAEQPEPIGGEPKWNFTKFLVDRTGKVVARFEPKVRPDDPELAGRVEELLQAGEESGGR